MCIRLEYITLHTYCVKTWYLYLHIFICICMFAGVFAWGFMCTFIYFEKLVLYVNCTLEEFPGQVYLLLLVNNYLAAAIANIACHICNQTTLRSLVSTFTFQHHGITPGRRLRIPSIMRIENYFTALESRNGMC
jgi:hypothetical protein